MNVATDPWIPVVTVKGEPILVSLMQVFTEGEKFADLAVRPYERVSLLRLFLCIAHAALDGPKDYEEWLSLPSRLSKSASQYLGTWHDSFELFDLQKPWLQAAGISTEADTPPPWNDLSKWTSTSKLCLTYASGHNPTLFDHEGMQEKRSITIEMAILSLLSYQCFSPGGLMPQVFWHEKQTTKSSRDSPCISESMLHAIIRGGNILTTIYLNMVPYEYILHFYEDISRPLWEMIPTSFYDEPNVQNATKTYLGRLVPLSRLVLLHQQEPYMLLGNALEYPTFSNGFAQEVTATVVRTKIRNTEKRILLSYRPTKSIWRQLPAILVKDKSFEVGGPLSLYNLRENQGFDLQVCALAHNKGSLLDVFESVIAIPAQLDSDIGRNTYDAEIKRSEHIADILGKAVEMYRKKLDAAWERRLQNAGPQKGALRAQLYDRAANFFWTAIEQNINLLITFIQALDTENAEHHKELWRHFLTSQALAAYNFACSNDTPRQILAFTEGWQFLNDTLIALDILPNQQYKQTEEGDEQSY